MAFLATEKSSTDTYGRPAFEKPNPAYVKKRATYYSYFCDQLEAAVNILVPKSSKNIFLEKNFAPVPEGSLEGGLPVEGTLPACLNGEFVRTGPNPRFEPIRGYHWFDGDGMLHGVRVKDGRAAYVNRYVATSRLAQEEHYGRPEFLRMGDIAGWTGLSKLLLDRVRKSLGVVDTSHGGGTGNTALVYHARRLLALHEGDAPYAIRVLQDGELETAGRQTYEGKLDHSFTAHPKVDPVTGEMFTFGYSVDTAPYVQYRVVGKDGAMGPAVPITIPDPVMMHDFAITEHYAVFMDLPLVFRPQDMVKTGMPFFFDKQRPARFGLLPRYDTSEAKLRWFDLPNGFIFHTANAWEEGDEVLLYACRFDDVQLKVVGNDGTGDDMPQFLYEFRFNLKTGESSQKQLTTFETDFPRINENYVGRKQRYVYCSIFEGINIVGVGKFDLQAEPKLDVSKYETGGCAAGVFLHGPARFGSEPVFVPASSDPRAPEDEGYLLNFVFDESTGKSEMVVVDARTMAAKPAARVLLPRRVPYGFHGIFVSEEQLQSQTDKPADNKPVAAANALA